MRALFRFIDFLSDLFSGRLRQRKYKRNRADDIYPHF